MVNPRNKGKTAELEVLHLFKTTMQSIEAELPPGIPHLSERIQRNSLQSAHGGYDLHGLPGVAVEVKRCETLQLEAWWQQCVTQATVEAALPVLVWRQSRQPWQCRTWTQLTDGVNVSHFVVASFPLANFLEWYAKFYRKFLLTLTPAAINMSDRQNI